MELRYQSTELIYVKPVGLNEHDIPDQALRLSIVHCPPFSGIGAEEKRMDRGAEPGGWEGQAGRYPPQSSFRGLAQRAELGTLVRDIQELFGQTLLQPEYSEALPFILCEYLGGIPPAGKGKGGFPQFDIASGGSGFHQVLLLLSFFYARPATVFLLDEPDAHLHVILQRQIYDRLRTVASRRDCQLIIATHSEVILDATPPARVVSFLGKPHPLIRGSARSGA